VKKYKYRLITAAVCAALMFLIFIADHYADRIRVWQCLGPEQVYEYEPNFLERWAFRLKLARYRMEPREKPADLQLTLPCWTVTGYGDEESWLIWCGGWLMDERGAAYACPDLSSLVKNWEKTDSELAYMDKKQELSTVSGAWSSLLLRPSDHGVSSNEIAPPPIITASVLYQTEEGAMFRIKARKWVCYNPVAWLEVLLDGSWYAMPDTEEPPPREAPASPGIPGGTILDAGGEADEWVAIGQILEPYGSLPAGRYRICLFDADFAFDIP